MALHSHIHIPIYMSMHAIRHTVSHALFAALLGLWAMVSPVAADADLTLLMVEEPGCIWCARWHNEVGPEYPITPEGLAAPLHQINIGQAGLGNFSLVSAPIYTPTFVLVEDGQEVGRIEGYPGEEFFWGLLTRLLDRAQPDWAAPTAN